VTTAALDLLDGHYLDGLPLIDARAHAGEGGDEVGLRHRRPVVHGAGVGPIQPRHAQPRLVEGRGGHEVVEARDGSPDGCDFLGLLVVEVGE
jgi:hypothetical protein